VAEVVSVTRVRETQEPYNADILPLIAPVTPAESCLHVP
jgi:hypothetical protein